jgi:hypothetical protein
MALTPHHLMTFGVRIHGEQARRLRYKRGLLRSVKPMQIASWKPQDVTQMIRIENHDSHRIPLLGYVKDVGMMNHYPRVRLAQQASDEWTRIKISITRSINERASNNDKRIYLSMW